MNLSFVITIDGYVNLPKYRYVYFVVVFIAYLIILCSNLSIIFLIVTQKSLHEPMYVFIAALLLNTVFHTTAFYPKIMIDVLSDTQSISYEACLFQFFMFYSSAGSEVLLLLVMACDRYVSICKPLQYPTIMNRRTVSILLLVAWLVPFAQILASIVLHIINKVCFFMVKGIFCNNSIKNLYCGRSRIIPVVGAVSLFNLILLPVILICCTYTEILCIAYRSSGEVRRKAAMTCLPHLLVLISFTCFTFNDIIISLAGVQLSKVVHLIVALQMIIYQPILNPIIYGLKMKAISNHLKKFFCRVRQNISVM